ncbi:uncharacterized protein LOC143491100 isoform X3 [Brachyhypopomus gauderio]|uniref:uncharacterized protein LOC143491100 isoform X3 n=1 Tax=Brachyhypopomus gauderio TaxID=698409 RepID=UPI004042DC59
MSGARKSRSVANALEAAITSPSERILKESHNLYVDNDNGVTDYLCAEISTSKQKKFSLVTFVDTPGLVDGDMIYPFDVNSAITSFGVQADLIFVFFDPMGQALCKRTLDIVEKLSETCGDKLHFYLSKADEAGRETDRQRVMMQIVQELCRRPGLNKCGFQMPTIYIPNPQKTSRCVNQINEVCETIEKSINQAVQKTLDQLESDCDLITSTITNKLVQDRSRTSHHTSRSHTTSHRYHTAQHHPTPHYTTLHHTTLHYTTPHRSHTTPHHTTPPYTTPPHPTPLTHHTTPHHPTLHYTTPHHTTPPYTTPPHIALHHPTPLIHHPTPPHTTPPHTAHTPPHTTLHHLTPHHPTPHRSHTTPHHPTLHYTTPHHTTPPHTAPTPHHTTARAQTVRLALREPERSLQPPAGV